MKNNINENNKKRRKVVDTKKSEYSLRKTLLAYGAVILIMMSLTGCSSKMTMQDPVYFTGENVQDASLETYYDISANGKKYFIKKQELASVIPNTEYPYDVGLKVDKNGNTVAVSPFEIHNTPDVELILTYCKKSYDKNGNVTVIMGNVDSAEVVDGYRVLVDGVSYDLKKSQIINYINTNLSLLDKLRGGIEFELIADSDGGPDLYTRKK